MIKRHYVLILLVLVPWMLSGRNVVISGAQKNITITGIVRDKGSREVLTGVTVIDALQKTGTSTNQSGYYSVSVKAGDYELQFSYIGYQTVSEKGHSDKDINLDISVASFETALGEVVVEGQKSDGNVKATEMSIVKLDFKTIRMVPAFLGEIDLIKVLQLLPGVQSTSEGSTGFSVRGGSADQNLILLDDATINNASHLLGFFSVFNNDAVKDVTLYKGDIPAAYGGRLSSLLDVKMKEGNTKQIGLTGSIGTVSSKITIDGPLIRDKTTFLVSGRRTYADLFLPFAKDKAIQDNQLYFYDLNTKISHIINSNNRLYFSGYDGRDIFKNEFARIGFGNRSGTLRWNHLFSSKLFMNLSLVGSRYNYQLGTIDGGTNSFTWKSRIAAFSLKSDFTQYISDRHTLKYGIASTYHNIEPGKAFGNSNTDVYTEFVLPGQSALEHNLYATDEFKTYGRLSLKYGLRVSVFQNMGKGTYYLFDSNFNPVNSFVYKKGEIFHSYFSLEPRLAFTYLLSGQMSVKGSYAHTTQFLSLAQNSTAGTPLDIWFPATPNVKPQLCDQLAVGWFRNLKENMFEVSAEIYYKDLKNVIDFRDHAQLILNKYLEGSGYSYGVETMIRKNDGKLTGWISYTYSRSYRIIPAINDGLRYNAPYDKPHSVNIVANYDISKRVTSSVTWVYASGIPVTFPTGRAVIGNSIVPIYSDRNSYRMEDYHRLDISVTLKGKQKEGKRWYGEWNLSIYNAYNRHNSWSVNFLQDAADPNITYAEKTYLFSVIPALTYNLKF
jgi:hypothetical protein